MEWYWYLVSWLLIGLASEALMLIIDYYSLGMAKLTRMDIVLGCLFGPLVLIVIVLLWLQGINWDKPIFQKERKE